MQDGSLSFVIPMRHQDSVSDWGLIKRNLSSTLSSIGRQTFYSYRVVVVANYGAELPPIPPRCEVAWVDLSAPRSPDKGASREAFNEVVRADKGRRLLAGIQHLRPGGHIMMTDGDDWVSPHLAKLVAENPTANGWFFDRGYLYSGGALAYLHPSEFFLLCGTSHIIRADLLLESSGFEIYDLRTIKDRLGSHVRIKRILDQEGTPLAPLPFVGTTYRVGHATSDSQSRALLSHLFPMRQSVRHPLETLRRIGRLRLADRTGFDFTP